MRDYNSTTDFEIVRTAVRAAGPAGGVIAATAKALQANGIAWPAGFNTDTRPHVLQLDRDICRAMEGLMQ